MRKYDMKLLIADNDYEYGLSGISFCPLAVQRTVETGTAQGETIGVDTVLKMPVRIIKDTCNILLNREDSLGAGVSSIVLPATYMDTPVAIKMYNTRILDTDIEREINTLSEFQGSHHIVQLLGSCSYQGRRSIVMDLAFNSTLSDFVYFVGENASYELRRRLARDVCVGLSVIHERGIAHEDLKPDNILLDFGLRAKLADFGSARRLDDLNNYGPSGTSNWKSPEKEKLEGPWDRILSDMYSLGKVLLEIFGTGADDTRAPEVAYKCLSANPKDRPTSCRDVLQALSLQRPSYLNFNGVLKRDIGESERINIAYYWTQFNKDEEESVTEHRRFFYTGDYDGLIRRVSQGTSCDAVCQILWAIATFHSGSNYLENDERKQQLLSTLQGLNLEDDSFPPQTSSLVQYYIALLLLSMNKRAEGMLRLSRLSNEGNSLAQAELAILSVSSQRKTVDQVESDAASFVPLVWRACKNGYCHFQALAVFLLIINRGQTTTLSHSEKQFLQLSCEGGSTFGQLLLDAYNDEVDDKRVIQSGSVELLYLLRVLYEVLGREERSWDYFVPAVRGNLRTCLSRSVLELIVSHFGSLREQGSVLLEAIKAQQEATGGEVDPESAYFLKLTVTEVEYVTCGLIRTYAAMGEEARAVSLAQEMECTTGLMTTLINLALSSDTGWETWHKIAMEKRDSGNATGEVLLAAARLLLGEAGKEELSRDWFEAAAQAGSLEACTAMANLEYSFRSPPSFDSAMKWLLQARKGGLVSAYFSMAMMIQHERNTNVDEEIFSYLAQGRLKGCVLCAHHIALLKECVGDVDYASVLCREAIDMGFEVASLDMLRLAKLTDSSEYDYWVRRAMRLVNPNLLLLYGTSYDTMPIQCLVDITAVDFVSSCSIVFFLGRFLEWAPEYETGAVTCFSCYSRAAQQGHNKAETFMARYLERVGRNAEAKEWYTKTLSSQRRLIGKEATRELIATLL